MARWLQKVVLIGGIALLGATGSGCGSAATPGPASSAAQPSVAAPASSGAPAPSAASPSTAGASPSTAGGAPGDPQPVATKLYKCSTLVSDTEMRSASGYAEAASSGDDQTGELSGQTYCQFFTGSAGISIAVSVFTAGQGWDMGFLPFWKLGQVTPGGVHLDGIGDGAIYGPTNHIGLALVSGHGISVVFSDMASGKLKGVDLQDQVTKILKIVAGRV